MKFEPLVKIPCALEAVYRTGRIGASKQLLDTLRQSALMKHYWPQLNKQYSTQHQWLMFLGAVRYAAIKANLSRNTHVRRVDAQSCFRSIATKLRSFSREINGTKFDFTIAELIPNIDHRSIGTLESTADCLAELNVHLLSSDKSSAKRLLKKSEYLLKKISHGKLIVNVYRLIFVGDFSGIHSVPFQPTTQTVTWPPKLSEVLMRLSLYADFLSREAMIEARPDERCSGAKEARVFIWHLSKILRFEQDAYAHGLVAAIANALGYGNGETTRERVRGVLKTFR